MTSSSYFAEGDLKPRKLTRLPPDEEIVISGLTGRFPESNNVTELQENLMNKRDLVTSDGRRWKLEHPEIPQRTGKLYNLEKFDALFFGVHFKQAHTMDPMCRVLLEQAYEAVIDAGVNPKQIRNSRTGVFIGACFSESEKTWFYDKLQVNGFGITGCARSMLSNRISYWLGVTGPSYTIDTACSSGLYAMEHAYRAIREGLCDSAIVGAANLCLQPLVSMQFFKLGVLSTDGRCKTFDESADGYVRSEAISVVFLQKAKDAKRVYATLVHGKINCDGFKEQGVTFPSSFMQSVLLQEFYMECGISPSLVNYIEAHGTGTRVGDPEEVNAIDRVFTPGRKSPLKIGSIKTNLGHSEPASGLCSVAKVIIAMESGIIPPNLHFKTPREDIKSLIDGTIQVVSEPTPWTGDYAGINSFGFGGANAHVLLKSNPKEKVNNGAPNDNLPRLVPISGRTEEAVTNIIDYLNSRPVDVEYLALYYNIYSEEINSHLYRGYTILPPRGLPEKPIKENVAFSGIKRPVWFVYSGMGSQWAGMGEMLLQLPVFAEAIKKCDAVLKPHGIDIFHVITNKEKTAFDNILNSFVGIAACQIGLTDVLRTLGIEPDYIIGHSVGELGCAYADGCFTAEQMILAAYSRGLASIETKIIHGSMAAVGLGYNDVKDLCPPDIEVACHNSAESSTISGPSESMKKFVAELTAKKIFAREVPCSNIPYHSRYIAPAGSKLLAYLKKVIPEPKARSSKWISSSVPKDKWNTPNALYSSAEYHTNNLLNAVLFEESSASIPKDAITIEIAPHGLLQAILRRSLPPTVTNIALTQRGHANNVEVLLQGIGKMFTVGMHPQVANIYPAVQFPVSRSTPMISPLIKWEHSDEWYVTSYQSQQKTSSGERQVKISISDSEFESINGHIIDGRNLFPATGYLDLVWESIGMMKGEIYTEVSVVFEDVKFLRATNIPKDGTIEFTVTVQKGTGRFEIVEGSAAVVTGYIRETNNATEEKINAPITINESEEESMTTRDVYKELRLRGYQYTGLYRGIVSATTDGSRGHLKWSSDWVSFMDTMLQMEILGTDSRSLFVPTSIKKLVIDTKLHLGQIQFGDTNKVFPCYVQKKYNTIVCGGIEICGLKANVISRKKPIGEPVLEEYKFVPHTDKTEVSLNELARLSTNICLENHLGIKIKTVELIDATDQLSSDDLLSPLVAESLGDMPLIQADVSIVSTKKYKDLPSTVVETDVKKIGADTNALLAMGHGLLTKDRADNLNLLLLAVKDNGFLLTQESTPDWDNFEKVAQNTGLDVILEKKHGQKSVLLLKKSGKKSQTSSVIFVDNNNFGWIEDMKKVMSEELDKKTSASNRVIFVGQGDFENGLMGLVNCLRKEPGGEIVRGILIQDSKAPKFSLEHPLYAKQLEKDLAVCVLRENRVWGSYRHLPLPPSEPKVVNHILSSQKTRGDISSLNWHEGPLRTDLKSKNLIKVYYSAINFKDVMLASGKLAVETFSLKRLEQEHNLGFEYSGIDESGKRIMGLLISKAMSNLVVKDTYLSWEIPKQWSLEDAVTVPCVYATCIYGLYKFGNMKRGDKVLIHAGSGGVGQAAIHLALHEGCEVFTTVGTPEKRKFIRDTYPQIPESHIGNSRDCSFELMIIRETNGQGVDIVLNSLAEEKLQASVRCLAPGGRFLEIGKFDLAANNPLGMEIFLREVSFKGIMVDLVICGSESQKAELHKLVAEKLKIGAIKPLIRTVFPKEEIEAAFRYMAAGKHIGKVLIKIRDEKEANTSPFQALPRYYCYNDRSYIILGGLGGFGLELADYLVLKGARKLVFTSRTGISNGYQKMRINLWKSYGVQVVVVAGKEASKIEDCKHILEAGSKLGPVDAIFNLAVVLKDALWDNQTTENFEESFKTKAWATQNLDVLSRKMCPHLRHFVVFSSVSCGRGNAGQTNYGMSNSIMERICEKRAAEGLPALAVQWGAVGDVGLVAEMQEDSKELVIGGTLQQRITSCLQELSEFLVQNKPVVSSMVVAEKRAGGDGALNVVDSVLNIMGLKDLKGVSPGTSLAELGMDSMMAVEIKQTLEREFEIFLTAQDIRNLNFSKLEEINEQVEKENVSSERTGDGVDLQGINLFMQLIGEHENINTVCLRLPSKAEQDRQEVFLIPGIEGLATVFGTLTPQIKAPATCLQLGLEHKGTITQMSNDFLSHVLERSKNRRQYTIVGYSYGACIAIELMRLLESKGMVGQLILIDGAPDHAKQIIKEHLDYETKEELENHVILAITNLFAPTFTTQLSTDLKTCKSYDEKIETFLSRIPKGAFKLPEDNQRSLCRVLYERLVALETYDITKTKQIKAPIILLKPTLPSIRGGSEDYGLSKVTAGSVEIHYVEGNHISILENEKVAAAINGETLENAEAFKNSLMDNKRC